MIARIGDGAFDPRNSEGRFGGNLAGKIEGGGKGGLGAVMDRVHKTPAARLFCGKPAAGISQLAHDAGRDQARQALKRADIGSHADLDFLDAEAGLRAGDPNIAGAGQIDAAAEADALNGGDHRHAQLFQRRKRRLKAPDQFIKRLGAPPRLGGGQAKDALKGGEVHTAAEMLAPPRKDDGPHRRVTAKLARKARQVGPEIGRHGVGLVPSVHLEMGNTPLDREGEERAFIAVGHRGLRSGWPQSDASLGPRQARRNGRLRRGPFPCWGHRAA
jgi:hypothetical protein